MSPHENNIIELSYVMQIFQERPNISNTIKFPSTLGLNEKFLLRRKFLVTAMFYEIIFFNRKYISKKKIFIIQGGNQYFYGSFH